MTSTIQEHGNLCLSCNKSRNLSVKYRVVIRFVFLYSISNYLGDAVIAEN